MEESLDLDMLPEERSEDDRLAEHTNQAGDAVENGVEGEGEGAADADDYQAGTPARGDLHAGRRDPQYFLHELHRLAGEPNDAIKWDIDGMSIIVMSESKLVSEIVPILQPGSNSRRFNGFARSLYCYAGFKIHLREGVNRLIHPLFQRDHPELLKDIVYVRRTVAKDRSDRDVPPPTRRRVAEGAAALDVPAEEVAEANEEEEEEESGAESEAELVANTARPEVTTAMRIAAREHGPRDPMYFLRELHRMAGEVNEAVKWADDGMSVIVLNKHKVISDLTPIVLPNTTCTRFRGFTRAVYQYGFRIRSPEGVMHWQHPLFQRDHPELMTGITFKRRASGNVDFKNERKRNTTIDDNAAAEKEHSEDDAADDEGEEERAVSPARRRSITVQQRDTPRHSPRELPVKDYTTKRRYNTGGGAKDSSTPASPPTEPTTRQTPVSTRRDTTTPARLPLVRETITSTTPKDTRMFAREIRFSSRLAPPENHLSLSVKMAQIRSLKWALEKQIAADKEAQAEWRDELREWQGGVGAEAAEEDEATPMDTREPAGETAVHEDDANENNSREGRAIDDLSPPRLNTSVRGEPLSRAVEAGQDLRRRTAVPEGMRVRLDAAVLAQIVHDRELAKAQGRSSSGLVTKSHTHTRFGSRVDNADEEAHDAPRAGEKQDGGATRPDQNVDSPRKSPRVFPPRQLRERPAKKVVNTPPAPATHVTLADLAEMSPSRVYRRGPCADCGAIQSSIWRTGRRWGLGGLSLCNACGIHRLRNEGKLRTDQESVPTSRLRHPMSGSVEIEEEYIPAPSPVKPPPSQTMWNGSMSFVLDGDACLARVCLTANDAKHFPPALLKGGRRLTIIHVDAINNIAQLASRARRSSVALATDVRIHSRDDRVTALLARIRADAQGVIAQVEGTEGPLPDANLVAIYAKYDGSFVSFLPPDAVIAKGAPTFHSLPPSVVTTTTIPVAATPEPTERRNSTPPLEAQPSAAALASSVFASVLAIAAARDDPVLLAPTHIPHSTLSATGLPVLSGRVRKSLPTPTSSALSSPEKPRHSNGVVRQSSLGAIDSGDQDNRRVSSRKRPASPGGEEERSETQSDATPARAAKRQRL